MKRIFLLLASILILSFWVGCTNPNSAQAQSTGYSLRFRGHGTSDIDRVKVRIDAPAVPADVGGNFTIEFWLKASLAENTSGACVPGGDHWINGNIIVDRDVYGNGDYGDYGISLAKGRIAFGVARGGKKNTICGTTNVANGKWHHIAVIRNSTDRQHENIRGRQLDAPGSAREGNISYRNNRTTSHPNSDPFLVFGAGKHDAGPGFPSYSGFMDEVRISKSIRYSDQFHKTLRTIQPGYLHGCALSFRRRTSRQVQGDDPQFLPSRDQRRSVQLWGKPRSPDRFTPRLYRSRPLPAPIPGGGPTLSGCPVYPADNIWNARVDNLPVHARSTAWINSIGRDDRLSHGLWLRLMGRRPDWHPLQRL